MQSVIVSVWLFNIGSCGGCITVASHTRQWSDEVFCGCSVWQDGHTAILIASFFLSGSDGNCLPQFIQYLADDLRSLGYKQYRQCGLYLVIGVCCGMKMGLLWCNGVAIVVVGTVNDSSLLLDNRVCDEEQVWMGVNCAGTFTGLAPLIIIIIIITSIGYTQGKGFYGIYHTEWRSHRLINSIVTVLRCLTG